MLLFFQDFLLSSFLINWWCGAASPVVTRDCAAGPRLEQRIAREHQHRDSFWGCIAGSIFKPFNQLLLALMQNTTTTGQNCLHSMVCPAILIRSWWKGCYFFEWFWAWWVVISAQFVISKSQKCAWLVSATGASQVQRNRRTNLSMPTIGESSVAGSTEDEDYLGSSSFAKQRRARSCRLPKTSSRTTSHGLLLPRRSPALQGAAEIILRHLHYAHL